MGTWSLNLLSYLGTGTLETLSHLKVTGSLGHLGTRAFKTLKALHLADSGAWGNREKTSQIFWCNECLKDSFLQINHNNTGFDVTIDIIEG